METMIYITLSALVVSIVISYLLVHFSNSNGEFQRGVIITITLVILVNILFLRHEAGKLVEPIKAAASALNQEKISATLIAYRKANDILAENENDVMNKALELRFKHFEKALSGLTRTGVLEVDLRDLDIIALSIVKSATRSIKATSYVDSSQWWKNPWGKKYFRLNEQKIRDGVTIDRIFIFENKEAQQKDADLLICSSEIGVNVHVLLLSNMSKAFAEDVIIIDDYAVGGQLVFGPTKEMKASNFSVNSGFIKDRLSVYETMELNSEPYSVPDGEKCSLYSLENR